jgi:hypothetical protein
VIIPLSPQFYRIAKRSQKLGLDIVERIPGCGAEGHADPKLFTWDVTRVIWNHPLAMVVQDWSSSGWGAGSMAKNIAI